MKLAAFERERSLQVVPGMRFMECRRFKTRAALLRCLGMR